MNHLNNCILKGFVLTTVLSLSLLIFGGCGGKDDGDNPPASNALTVQHLFPLEQNVMYEFEGMGNEFATFTIYNEYVDDDSVQQRVDNGGSVTARVYVISDGKVTRTLSKGETYYREDMMDQTDDSAEVVLMEPIETGTSWQLADGSTRTITDIAVDVATPAGNYQAVEVVTEGESFTNTDYYAKGVGHVKTVYLSEKDDTEVSSTLKQIIRDTVRLESIQFFFPNINDGKIYIKNKQLTFMTNSITDEVLETGYKEALVDNVGAVFSANTKINSLKLNKAGKVELDLNSAFLTEMNAGSSYESMILQSLANTFCRYYNAQELILTIYGKPYSSGHIEMQEGESIKADFKGTIEIDV
jgi:hypothetical protein